MLVNIVDGKPEGYLTLTEAAKKFGVTNRSVQNWCKRGYFDASEMFFIRNSSQVEAYYISEKAKRPTFISKRGYNLKKKRSPYDYYTNIKNDLIKYYPTIIQFNLSKANLKRFLDKGLTKREEIVFKQYYDESRTLEDIAHDLSVSRERIRQIKMKALRKIQKQLIYEQKTKENELPIPEIMDNEALLELPRAKSIDELDLSVRALNCLSCRVDIDTIPELLKWRPEKLVTIRGLGRKTYQEIIDKVHEHGYKFNWEE